MPRHKKIQTHHYWWRIIRSTFGGRCQDCGEIAPLTSPKKQFDIHHIDGNRDNNTLKNLLLVCRRCAGKRHKFLRSGLLRGIISLKILERWEAEAKWDALWKRSKEEQNLIDSLDEDKEQEKRLKDVEDIIRIMMETT